MNQVFWFPFPNFVPPHDTQFVWVMSKEYGVQLATWNEYSKRFETAESCGDREGLYVETYYDTTHWARATEPSPPQMLLGHPIVETPSLNKAAKGLENAYFGNIKEPK